MNSPTYQPIVYRFAVATLLVSLLPIVIGALVTTKNAGMAFADWPSSDGHNMLAYPLLESSGDEFIEHVHRLAGVLIGLTTIGLVVATRIKESRRWIKRMSLLVLLAVILQGILGGLRVLYDSQSLALLHGIFAAMVFTLMTLLAMFTSRFWLSMEADVKSKAQSLARDARNYDLARLKPLAVVTPFIICIQYILGGLLRHLGTALHEHLALAAVVLVFVVLTTTAAFRSGAAWLRRPSFVMLAAVLLQLMLGAGAWVTKFGFASIGYVAVQHSTAQIALRTGHTVLGMVLLAASVVNAICVFRLASLQPFEAPISTTPAPLSKTIGARAKGGVR